jgi:UDP-GlcNAc:undecaprenyl-phosphate/decaprenyl-phosphate GlcNAc-1-phosphate transferase
VSWAGVRGAVVSAAVARLSYAAAARRPPGGAARWTRRNHRGEPVTLLEGPAVAIGAMAGVLSSTGLDRGSQAALLAAAAGAAAFGGYDDLAGRGDRRGFRGHLGALRDGELTTGAIKLGGIGGTGLLASALLRTRGPAAPSGVSAADFVLNAGLVAGGANLLNLFDLRPGRAIKVLLGASALLTAAPGARVVAGPAGAAAALLPEDLRERAMLGDAGANALGGMLGAGAAIVLPRPARLAVLAAIIGLTAASEVVSFTQVIERTGPLRWIDMLGRRPPPGMAGAPAESAPADGAGTGRQPPATPAAAVS